MAPHFASQYFDSQNVPTGSTLLGRYVLTSNVSSSRRQSQTLLKADCHIKYADCVSYKLLSTAGFIASLSLTIKCLSPSEQLKKCFCRTRMLHYYYLEDVIIYREAKKVKFFDGSL